MSIIKFPHGLHTSHFPALTLQTLHPSSHPIPPPLPYYIPPTLPCPIPFLPYSFPHLPIACPLHIPPLLVPAFPSPLHTIPYEVKNVLTLRSQQPPVLFLWWTIKWKQMKINILQSLIYLGWQLFCTIMYEYILPCTCHLQTCIHTFINW